ncbi:hypothetical protein CSOJ01_03857 [Colletotrichum sojae]|uniref:C2H2-type domain-containing protein n=1 Tax=Colletotrichum sojae TaxID=2175907 RepID=A0A8H6N0C8_9PEZI|nr:hypothetical protein CSOJ01_03857 [Colletotrichum sojae]
MRHDEAEGGFQRVDVPAPQLSGQQFEEEFASIIYPEQPLVAEYIDQSWLIVGESDQRVLATSDASEPPSAADCREGKEVHSQVARSAEHGIAGTRAPNPGEITRFQRLRPMDSSVVFAEDELRLGNHQYYWDSHYHCHICGRKKHLRTHSRPVHCPICTYTSATRRDMKKHYESHCLKERFVCLCGRSYSRMDNLERHIQHAPTGVSRRELYRRRSLNVETVRT